MLRSTCLVLAITVLAAPVFANDDCSEATLIGDVLYVTGDLSTATHDGEASCGQTLSAADRWYTYTAPVDVVLRVSTCGSNDAYGVDTVLSVHSGCPGTTVNQIECNDDWITGSDVPRCQTPPLIDEGVERDSAIAVVVAAGETVWVRVSHYGPSTPGQYDFLAFASPINDECSNAAPLFVGTTEGTTDLATFEGHDGSCASGDSENDVWYEFTAPAAGRLEVSVSAGQYLSAYSSCDLGGEVACANGAPLSMDLAQSESVLVRVAPSVKLGSDFLLTTNFVVGVPFRRADANTDGAFDISDAIFTLGTLFTSGPASTCADAADANDDGAVDIGDAVFSLSALFSGGPAPTAPGTLSCGMDPTDDVLECGAYAACP